MTQQYLHAIADASTVNIGLSRDPEACLAKLQSFNGDPLVLVGYIPGDHVTVRELHEQFRDYRLYGSWFQNEGPVIGWVSELKRERVAA